MTIHLQKFVYRISDKIFKNLWRLGSQAKGLQPTSTEMLCEFPSLLVQLYISRFESAINRYSLLTARPTFLYDPYTRSKSKFDKDLLTKLWVISNITLHQRPWSHSQAGAYCVQKEASFSVLLEWKPYLSMC